MPQSVLSMSCPSRGVGFFAGRMASLMLIATAVGPTWAVGPRPPAVPTDAYPYVGRVADETHAANDFGCTGSEIRQGVVLTAGHCVSDYGLERFELVGSPRYSGLGVQTDCTGVLEKKRPEEWIGGRCRPDRGALPAHWDRAD